jgi:hypothetical protein
MKSGFFDAAGFSERPQRRRPAVRNYFIPAAIAAAARAAKAQRPQEAGVPLYLPAFDDRRWYDPALAEAEDVVIDASGITVGGDEDDDFY